MSLPPRLPPRQSLPHITSDAVAKALDGFNLAFDDGRDVNWLAAAVKRMMEYAVLEPEYSPHRMSNADARRQVVRMADAIEAALKALRTCDRVVELQLASFASMTAEDDGPTGYGKMLRAIDDLEPLLKFLRDAEDDFESQRGPWRQSEERFWRVERARSLALIFQLAFGEPPTANNYPNDARHRKPTPFMDFYSRMAKLAFGPRETTNLAEVTKEACKIHRNYPDTFAADLAAVS